MGQIKPRRSRSFYSNHIYDPRDGLEINRIKWGRPISANKLSMSIYDNPSVYLMMPNGRHREVGIARKISRTNRYKGLNMNSQVGLLNRKVYNV